MRSTIFQTHFFRKLMAVTFSIAFLASPTSSHAWFFFIPGSLIQGASDALTGAKGNICVGENAKAGDTLPSPAGNIATIKSVSGTSSMCTNPALPIRSEVEFQFTFKSKAVINLPDEFEAKPIADLQRFQGAILRAASKTAPDTGVLAFAYKRVPTSDLASRATTAETGMKNALANAVSGSPEQLVINGAKALRFEVNGKLKSLFGSQMTYLLTVIEGDSEIVVVNAFSPSSSDESYKKELKKYAESLTGIKAAGDTPPAILAKPPDQKGMESPDPFLSILNAPAPAELPKNASGPTESVMKNVSSPPESAAKSVPTSTADSVANRLRELNGLYKDGVITEKEFEAKKQELLGKM